MLSRSATAATAAAAIATIPAVLFRSCTAQRIGGGAEAGLAGTRARATARGYWNVTGNESELLLVFFSPGTFSMVATTV